MDQISDNYENESDKEDKKVIKNKKKEVTFNDEKAKDERSLPKKD